MSTIFLNSFWQSDWTPAQPTTSGGVLPHTWEVPGVSNFQDAAKTTVAAVTDPVGAVVNQGSDVHDIVQATAANRPTLQQVTINDVVSYVWRFDGVNDFLRGAFGGGAISPPLTTFAVVKMSNAPGSTKVIIDGDDSTKRNVFFRNVTNFAIYSGSIVQGVGSNSNWNIWTGLFSTTGQLWLNGSSFVSGNSGTQSVDGLTVGSNYIGTECLLGDVGQILTYPGNLSTADKNQVGEYLERVTGIAWTTIT